MLTVLMDKIKVRGLGLGVNRSDVSSFSLSRGKLKDCAISAKDETLSAYHARMITDKMERLGNRVKKQEKKIKELKEIVKELQEILRLTDVDDGEDGEDGDDGDDGDDDDDDGDDGDDGVSSDDLDDLSNSEEF